MVGFKKALRTVKVIKDQIQYSPVATLHWSRICYLVRALLFRLDWIRLRHSRINQSRGESFRAEQDWSGVG